MLLMRHYIYFAYLAGTMGFLFPRHSYKFKKRDAGLSYPPLDIITSDSFTFSDLSYHSYDIATSHVIVLIGDNTGTTFSMVMDGQLYISYSKLYGSFERYYADTLSMRTFDAYDITTPTGMYSAYNSSVMIADTHSDMLILDRALENDVHELASILMAVACGEPGTNLLALSKGGSDYYSNLLSIHDSFITHASQSVYSIGLFADKLNNELEALVSPYKSMMKKSIFKFLKTSKDMGSHGLDAAVKGLDKSTQAGTDGVRAVIAKLQEVAPSSDEVKAGAKTLKETVEEAPGAISETLSNTYEELKIPEPLSREKVKQKVRAAVSSVLRLGLPNISIPWWMSTNPFTTYKVFSVRLSGYISDVLFSDAYLATVEITYGKQYVWLFYLSTWLLSYVISDAVLLKWFHLSIVVGILSQFMLAVAVYFLVKISVRGTVLQCPKSKRYITILLNVFLADMESVRGAVVSVRSHPVYNDWKTSSHIVARVLLTLGEYFIVGLDLAFSSIITGLLIAYMWKSGLISGSLAIVMIVFICYRKVVHITTCGIVPRERYCVGDFALLGINDNKLASGSYSKEEIPECIGSIIRKLNIRVAVDRYTFKVIRVNDNLFASLYINPRGMSKSTLKSRLNEIANDSTIESIHFKDESTVLLYTHLERCNKISGIYDRAINNIGRNYIITSSVYLGDETECYKLVIPDTDFEGPTMPAALFVDELRHNDDLRECHLPPVYISITPTNGLHASETNPGGTTLFVVHSNYELANLVELLEIQTVGGSTPEPETSFELPAPYDSPRSLNKTLRDSDDKEFPVMGALPDFASEHDGYCYSIIFTEEFKHEAQQILNKHPLVGTLRSIYFTYFMREGAEHGDMLYNNLGRLYMVHYVEDNLLHIEECPKTIRLYDIHYLFLKRILIYLVDEVVARKTLNESATREYSSDISLMRDVKNIYNILHDDDRELLFKLSEGTNIIIGTFKLLTVLSYVELIPERKRVLTLSTFFELYNIPNCKVGAIARTSTISFDKTVASVTVVRTIWSYVPNIYRVAYCVAGPTLVGVFVYKLIPICIRIVEEVLLLGTNNLPGNRILRVLFEVVHGLTDDLLASGVFLLLAGNWCVWVLRNVLNARRVNPIVMRPVMEIPEVFTVKATQPNAFPFIAPLNDTEMSLPMMQAGKIPRNGDNKGILQSDSENITSYVSSINHIGSKLATLEYYRDIIVGAATSEQCDRVPRTIMIPAKPITSSQFMSDSVRTKLATALSTNIAVREIKDCERTAHLSNKCIYNSLLNDIIDEIPHGSVVIDVGSSLGKMTANGVVCVMGDVCERDTYRLSRANRTITTSAIVSVPTVKNFCDIDTRADILVFNYVHDVELSTMALQARRLGVRKIIITLNVSSSLLINGFSIMPYAEQVSVLDPKTKQIYTNFMHDGEVYINDYNNMLAPLFVKTIKLPNNGGYYHMELKSSRDTGRCIVFNWSASNSKVHDVKSVTIGGGTDEEVYVALKNYVGWNTVETTYQVLPADIYNKIANNARMSKTEQDCISSVCGMYNNLESTNQAFTDLVPHWRTNLGDLAITAYHRNRNLQNNSILFNPLVIIDTIRSLLCGIVEDMDSIFVDTVQINQNTLDLSSVILHDSSFSEMGAVQPVPRVAGDYSMPVSNLDVGRDIMTNSLLTSDITPKHISSLMGEFKSDLVSVSRLNSYFYLTQVRNNILMIQSLIRELDQTSNLVLVTKGNIAFSNCKNQYYRDTTVLIKIEYDTITNRLQCQRLFLSRKETEKFIGSLEFVQTDKLWIFLACVAHGIRFVARKQCWRIALDLPLLNEDKLNNASDDIGSSSNRVERLKYDLKTRESAIIYKGVMYTDVTEYYKLNTILYADDSNHVWPITYSKNLALILFTKICSLAQITFAVNGDVGPSEPLFTNDKALRLYISDLLNDRDYILSRFTKDTNLTALCKEYLQYVVEAEIQSLSYILLYHKNFGMREARQDPLIHIYNNRTCSFVNGTYKGVMSMAWDGAHYVMFDKDSRKFLTNSTYCVFTDNMLYARNKNIIYLYRKYNSKLNKLNNSNYDITLVDGVPGCGKTTSIMRAASVNKENLTVRNKVMILTETLSGALEYGNFTKPNRRVRTYDSLFMSRLEFDIEELYCDEALMVHPAEILLAAVIVKCNKIIMYGDSKQIPFISRLSYFSLNDDLKLRYNVTRSLVTYRNPPSALPALKLFYPDIVSKGNILAPPPRVIKIRTIPRLDDYDVIITFSQFEKAGVMHLNKTCRVHTIHEVQGGSFDNVAIVRYVPHENALYESQAHILVAISRHKQKLDYYTIVYDDLTSKILRNKIDQLDTTGIFISDAHTHKTNYRYVHAAHVPLKHLKSTILEKYPNILKALRLSNLTQDGKLEERVLLNLQYNQDNILEPGLATVQGALDCLFDRTDRAAIYENRLRVADEIPNDIKLLETNPKLFQPELLTDNEICTPLLYTPCPYDYTKELSILVEAIVKRNLKPPVLCIDRNCDYVNSTVDKFMDMYLDPSKLQDARSECTYNNMLRAMDWFNTRTDDQLQLINDKELYRANFSVYSSSVKNKGKAKLDNSHNDEVAAPQIITAHNPAVTAYFTSNIKTFSEILRRSLKSNWVINDSYDADTLSAKVNNIICNQENLKFLEVDFSKFDKSQDIFSLLVMIELMRRLGVPHNTLMLWEDCHIRNKLIFHEGVRLDVSFQRRSGDVLTFIGNTVVSMMALAVAYGDNTALGGVFGGDDSIVFYGADQELRDTTKLISDIFNLVAKIEHYPDAPMFSSRFLIQYRDNWVFVPDPLKAIVKLGRHDILNKWHATCYYISFKDNYNQYLSNEIRELVAHKLCLRYSKKLNITNDIASIIVNFIAYIVTDPRAFLGLYDYSNAIKVLPKNKEQSVLNEINRSSHRNITYSRQDVDKVYRTLEFDYTHTLSKSCMIM